MRALHLIDHMGAGGAQRTVLDLLEARDRGLDVSVVSLRSLCLPEARERVEASGASYRGLGLSRWNPLPVWRIREALLERPVDVVHTHLEYSDSLGVLATHSLGSSRPRVINHVHNYPERQYGFHHRLAGRVLASRTDAHVVATPGMALAVRRSFGGLRRLEVIPYGIDPAWLEASGTEKSLELRAGARRVVGTVARLAPQKSIEHLLLAMPRLLESEPSTRLLIVGDGPSRSQLEATAHRLGIAAFAHFTGYLRDVASAYAAMDVFVLPSRYEGMPMALIETMAMGIPVVGTRVQGIADLIEDETTGLLVPHGDPQALASAVLRLLSDAALRERIRWNARSVVRRDHTRERMAARFEALYAELCAERAD